MPAGGRSTLFHGRRTREHEDIDVQILRADHVAVRAALFGWDAHAADPPGTLFQLMIADVDGDDWVYRRDHRIRRPIAELSGPASTATRQVLAAALAITSPAHPWLDQLR